MSTFLWVGSSTTLTGCLLCWCNLSHGCKEGAGMDAENVMCGAVSLMLQGGHRKGY